MIAISSDMRWFFRGSFVTVALKSISMLVSLAFVSVLSFVMPQSEYGLFAMVISTVLFGAAIGILFQANKIDNRLFALLVILRTLATDHATHHGKDCCSYQH